MGSMSASDAAPLPRLGEVFFDVRGSSRSMRLSWYSDTGVAVFSIWQGGTCTGTFRLPIDDLPRMVDALQRGPRGSGPPGGDAPDLTGLPGGRSSLPEAPAPYAEFATGQHLAPVTGEFGRLDLAERETDPFGSGGYRPRSPSPEPVYSPAPPPSPSYRDRDRDREDPLTSPSFRDEARSGGYRQQAPAAPLPAPTPSPSYRDRDRDREDPLTSPSFRDEARSTGYRDSGEHRYYGDDSLGSGGYGQPPWPADDSYPPGYRDDDSSGYRGRRYRDDPFQSNYPDDARGGAYPYDSDPRSHRGRPIT